MVSSREIDGTFSFREAVVLCRWPVAEHYYVYDGGIWPDSEADWRTWTAPLSDSNLFLSLANLGGRGEELPEDAALRWVRRHGLLDRLDEGSNQPRTPGGEMNQRPLSVSEFREEARIAHRVLTLLRDVRSERVEALRARLGSERFRNASDPMGREWERLTLDGAPVLGTDRPLSETTLALSELTDEQIVDRAWYVLTQIVQGKLKGLEPVFVPVSAGNEDPRLSFCAPDLRTAIWLQVASLIDRKRPMKTCEVCGQPFPLTRSDRRTCSDRCRKRKSLRK